MTTKRALKDSAAKLSPSGVGVLDLGDRKVELKLTLAAMSRIEVEFGLESIADIDSVMERPSAKKICFLISALAVGEVSAEDILSSQLAREGDIQEIALRLGAVLSGQSSQPKNDAGNAAAPSA